MISDTVNQQFTKPAAVVTEKPAEQDLPTEVNHEKQPDLTPEKQKQIEKINHYMAEQKPFLNPELTLMDLSQNLNIPKHQITLLLNNHLGKNFFEYVNEFRIEETKKRMIDPQYEHLTLVAIAYECGFNSKSTFNTFFKNATGLTPTEWRKENKTKED
jgi:AraC-like DNA-binding protein